MTITEYINKQTIPALLDNNQQRLDGLLEAARLAIGERCPDCGSADVSDMNREGEIWCTRCDEPKSALNAAVEKLQDLGYEVYAER